MTTDRKVVNYKPLTLVKGSWHQSRKETLARLKNEELDLLIVGGGITGAGVALQAVASGIKTGLVEMQDFAEGTSGNSKNCPPYSPAVPDVASNLWRP